MSSRPIPWSRGTQLDKIKQNCFHFKVRGIRRTALLLRIVAARGSAWYMEQPVTSLLRRHHRIQEVFAMVPHL